MQKKKSLITKKCPLNDVHNLQTKVNLVDCYNQELEPYTAKKLEDIAKGIKNHCFIYHLCNQLPAINVNENIAGKWQSFDVKQFFKLEAKDKEKQFLSSSKNLICIYSEIQRKIIASIIMLHFVQTLVL